jgi:hypothetical protein
MQEDIELEVAGPPVAVAFGHDGPRPRRERVSPAPQGVPLSALQRKKTPKGEVVSAVKK